jgi:hypothetical protein
VYDGAKLFYLSGMQHGKYLKREVRLDTVHIGVVACVHAWLTGDFALEKDTPS